MGYLASPPACVFVRLCARACLRVRVRVCDSRGRNIVRVSVCVASECTGCAWVSGLCFNDFVSSVERTVNN